MLIHPSSTFSNKPPPQKKQKNTPPKQPNTKARMWTWVLSVVRIMTWNNQKNYITIRISWCICMSTFGIVQSCFRECEVYHFSIHTYGIVAWLGFVSDVAWALRQCFVVLSSKHSFFFFFPQRKIEQNGMNCTTAQSFVKRSNMSTASLWDYLEISTVQLARINTHVSLSFP